jgi:hypothetical protein
MSALDVVYLKNVLLKFIAAQSAGKTQVCMFLFFSAGHLLPGPTAAQH